MSILESGEDKAVQRAIEITIKIGVLLIISNACYDIIRPFITPIIWAAIIAVAVKPISDWFEETLSLGRKLAVILITSIMLALLIALGVITASKMTTTVQGIADKLEQGNLHISDPNQKVKEWPIIGVRVYQSWTEATDNFEEYLQKHRKTVRKVAGFALEKASGAGKTIFILTFSIILSGVFLGYFDNCRTFLIRFSKRLMGEKGEKFVSLAGVTIRNVTRGILGVAILQALLAGAGFHVVGLPAAPLLALVVMVMSIIRLNPIILLVALAIYVFSYASPFVAIIYLLWSIVVGLLDNLLTPMIMGQGAQVPTMVIFLGAIGGFLAMGFAGLFVGAVILAMGYELFLLWLNQGVLEPGAQNRS